MGKPDTLLETVRQLINLRRNHPALCADGDFVPACAEQVNYPFAYLRSKPGSQYLVAVNPGGKHVSADIAIKPGKYQKEILAGKGATLLEKDGRLLLEMEGVSYAVFKLK